MGKHLTAAQVQEKAVARMELDL